MIAEYGNTGSLEAKYIAGVGLDEWLVMDNGLGRYYYAEDGLGSTRYLTDTSGNLVEQYQYDPYGNVSIFDAAGTQRLASDANNPYLFTGRRFDTETGLYHYRNRGYHPEFGRFLQRDPLGYIDSLNLYSYVVNNPGNWVDPFGEAAFAIPVLVGSGPPGWFVLVVVGGGGYIGWKAWQESRRNNGKEDDRSSADSDSADTSSGTCPANSPGGDNDEASENHESDNDYPANPDDWTPPPGWVETPAGEKTGGRHRQWKGPDGNSRRWDRKGRPSGKDRGPHWHDSDHPGEHIPPNR